MSRLVRLFYLSGCFSHSSFSSSINAIAFLIRTPIALGGVQSGELADGGEVYHVIFDFFQIMILLSGTAERRLHSGIGIKVAPPKLMFIDYSFLCVILYLR